MTINAEDLAQLQQLANRYWAHADMTEPAELADLFLPDAVFQLGTMRLEGLPAIEAFFAKRAETMAESGRTTRHMATNFLAVPETPDRVRVRASVTVFAADGDHPLPANLPSGIADFEDICERTPDGSWLYRSRSASTVFVGPSAASFAR